MSILAIDWGTKHVGLAISYAGVYAKELGVLSNNKSLFDELKRVVARQSVDQIVVGLPLNNDGTPARIAPKVRSFATKLSKQLGLPAHFEDEHLTTKEAVRQLAGRVDPTDQRIDSFSAKLILEQHLARNTPP